MKRIIPGLFFILIFPLIVFTQSARIIKENANLRGSATQAGKVVTVLPYGSEVEVIKQAGPWFLVQSPEYVGWLHGNTIEYRSGTYTMRAEPPRTYTYVPPPPITIVEPVQIYEAPKNDTWSPSVPQTIPEPVSTTPTAICNDGTVSYSMNRSGTCSHHGGVSSWMNEPAPSAPRTVYDSPSSSPGGTVQVKGYYRKDGTYVRPHTRRSPRRN